MSVGNRLGGQNRCTNPSFETNLTSWNIRAGTTATVSTEQAKFGTSSAKLVTGSGGNQGMYLAASTAGVTLTGVTHLVSSKMWVYAAAPLTFLRIQHQVNYTDASTVSTYVDVGLGGKGWQEVTIPPFSTDPAKTIQILYLQVLTVTGHTGATLYVDGVDCRVDEIACDTYIDGSLGAGYAWLGTAHNSASTRSAIMTPFVPNPVTRGGRNRFSNPSAETNAAAWSPQIGGAHVVASTDAAWVGNQAVRLVLGTPNNSQLFCAADMTGLPTTGIPLTMTAKYRIWAPLGMTFKAQLYFRYTPSGADVQQVGPFTGTGAWQEITLGPFTSNPANVCNGLFVYPVITGVVNSNAWVCYLDGMDVRIGEPDADDYIDGSLGTRYTWVGTAHASASIRAAQPDAFARREQIVRGGRNNVLNPSFEVDTASWSLTGAAGSSMVKDTQQVWVGSSSLLVNFTATSQDRISTTIPLGPLAATGQKHQVRAQLRAWIPLGMKIPRVLLRTNYSDGAVDTVVDNVVGTGDWQTITLPLTSTDPARTLVSFLFYPLYNVAAQPGSWYCWIDGLDVRFNEPDVDEFISGSLGTGYAWTGTVHNSASTRASVQPPHAVAPPSRGGRNRIKNPSAETNVSLFGQQGGMIVLSSDDIAWVGTKSLKCVVQAAVNTILYQAADLTSIPVIATSVDPHLIHGRIRFWALNNVRVGRFLFRTAYNTAGVVSYDDKIIDGLIGTSDWQTVVFPATVTDPAKTISAVYLYHYTATLTNVDAPYVIYLDGFDVRIDEPDIDDYIDGSLGTRYAWTGAAHASMSTRLAKPLPVPPDPFAITAGKNWIANPSVEVKSDDIGLQGSAKQAMSADASVYGTKSLKVVTHPTAQYSGPYFPASMSGISAGSHVLRARFNILLGAGVLHPGVSLRVTFVGVNVPAEAVTKTVVGTGEWQTVDLEMTTSASKTIAGVSVIFNMGTVTRTIIFFVDGVDLRVDAPMDGYIDGSLSPRYSWTGTKHNSPSLRAAITVTLPKLPKTGPITLSGELWKCTVGGSLLEDISREVLSGRITWSADRSDPGSSGGTQMSAEFVLRHPERLLPYMDFITPFLNVDYGNGDTIRQQLGIYLTDIPNKDFYPTESQAQVRGKDLTWIMANSVPTGGYHALVGQDFSFYLRQIVLASGLSLTNIRDSTRALGYTRSFTPGMSYLEMFNKLAGGIGWYPAFMDMAGNIVSLPYRIFTDNTPVATVTTGQVVNIVKSTPETTGIGNVCVVIKDNGAKPPYVVIRKNQDPRSAISIPNVGREIMIDGAPIRNGDIEALGDAKALAKYKIQLGASYTDTLDLEILPDPRQGTYRTLELDLGDFWSDLAGRYWVKSWEIGFTPEDGPTKLKVARVVNVSDDLDEET